MVIEPAWADLLKSVHMDSIPGVVTSPLGEIISQDRKMEKNDVKRLEVEWSGRKYVFYVKRYYNYLFEKIWKRAFRGSWWPPSMVKSEFVNLKRLEKWGINIPEPVAYGEHRFGGGLINAFIISLEIPQAMGLDYLVNNWLPDQPPHTQKSVRAELIDSLAEVTRRMHDHGFEHHDYFLRNIMVSDFDFSKLFILDAPRGRAWPRWLGRLRAPHDLATLDAAAPKIFRRTERLRFFLKYRGHHRLTSSDKAMIRRIMKLALPWRDRQIRRLHRSLHVEA